MNSIIDTGVRYLTYLLRSNNEHGIHSPFVYNLYTKVIKDIKNDPAYNVAEQLRRRMKADKRILEITDFGAGSLNSSNRKRRVSEIANSAAKPAKFGKLLYRLCRHFQTQDMLELGTSLGISSVYQALGARTEGGRSHFISCEGDPAVAQIATQNFESLSLTADIIQRLGNFDEILPEVLKEFEKLDYVFFDGNHRYLPTVNYFEQCVQRIHNDSFFVIDDINWSTEMRKAWSYIKAHPKVTVTVDLFFVGLVFFRKEQGKEDFILRF